MRAFMVFLIGMLPVFAVASPVPLAIDPAQSRIEIIVKATVDSFVGTLDAYKTDIAVEDGQVAAAIITFRFADVHTGKSGRDEAMHDWQETSRHPDGVFTLKSLERTGADGRMDARGSLTFHGVSRAIAFPVVISTDSTHYTIAGEASLDTRDFGLPVIRKLGLLKVDPLVRVRFHFQGSVGGNVSSLAL